MWFLPSIKDESNFSYDGNRAVYFYTKDEVLVEYLMVQDAENLQQFSSLIKFGFFKNH